MSDTAFYCRCGLRVQGSERLYHRCDPSLDEVTHVLFGDAPSMDIAAALSAIRGSSEAVQRATAWLLQQSAERLSSGGPTEGQT